MWQIHWTELVSFLVCAIFVGGVLYAFWRVPITEAEKASHEKKLGVQFALVLVGVMSVGFLIGGSQALRPVSQWPWRLLPQKGLLAPKPNDDFVVKDGKLVLEKEAPSGQLWVVDPRTAKPFFAVKGQSFDRPEAWTVNFQDASTGEVSPAIPVLPGK